MTNFELIDVSYGWDHYTTPDDITFNIESGSISVELFASLRDLGVLYTAVTYNEDIDCYIGTGDQVKTRFSNGTIFKINDINIEGSSLVIQKELRSLLEVISRRKDDIDPGNKKAAIEKIDSNIDNYYFENEDTMVELYS